MISTLNLGHLGIPSPGVEETIRLAHDFGFAGATFSLSEAAEWVRSNSRSALQDLLSESNVQWPAFGLPVDWRKDPADLERGVQQLQRDLEVLGELAPKRTATWIMPGSDTMTPAENEVFHRSSLKVVADALAPYEIRLGLEFIGAKTLRDRFPHRFHYQLPAMKALAHRIGPNVGLLLDSFHWFTSGGTREEIEACDASDIVLVHVNDAMPGRSREEQIDNDRALPLETGVIDLAEFMGALRRIRYEGPVEVEPFSARLKGMDDHQSRIRETAESIKAALLLAR